jgi:hypothetical protein
MKFNYQAVGHTLLGLAIFIIPMVFHMFPEVGNLTLSGVLLLLQQAYIQTT